MNVFVFISTYKNNILVEPSTLYLHIPWSINYNNDFHDFGVFVYHTSLVIVDNHDPESSHGFDGM